MDRAKGHAYCSGQADSSDFFTVSPIEEYFSIHCNL